MRIKKKNIRESIDSKASEKITDISNTYKDEIEKTSKGFEDMGIDDEDAKKVATNVVTSVVDGDEVNETLLPGMMDKDGNSIPATCFAPIGLKAESFNPKMTKNELIATVLSEGKSRRIIKTLKIKDLRK